MRSATMLAKGTALAIALIGRAAWAHPGHGLAASHSHAGEWLVGSGVAAAAVVLVWWWRRGRR
jgi:hypothetical protein